MLRSLDASSCARMFSPGSIDKNSQSQPLVGVMTSVYKEGIYLYIFVEGALALTC